MYILALQSIYEESMPRPCKEMVRGEILPSAWILQPDTMNGKYITKVIYMVQVGICRDRQKVIVKYGILYMEDCFLQHSDKANKNVSDSNKSCKEV